MVLQAIRASLLGSLAVNYLQRTKHTQELPIFLTSFTFSTILVILKNEAHSVLIVAIFSGVALMVKSTRRATREPWLRVLWVKIVIPL